MIRKRWVAGAVVIDFDEELLAEARKDILSLRQGHLVSLEVASRRAKRWAAREHHALFDAALEQLKSEAARIRKLAIPPGVGAAYSTEEERIANWYSGPKLDDKVWPPLAASLKGKFPDEDFQGLDAASSKVVANLADPYVEGLKKRGLVLGHVQSGKTANYTSAIAKAADAGYRLVIVLAGMHNNLRRQTQARLLSDLSINDWVQLTDEERDFGGAFPGTAHMSNSRTRMLAVVKKNDRRLRHLKKWLSEIPRDIRATCPTLLLDDEADQATPNTAAARQEMSAINKHLRDIWALIPTGSYVGYTATPFATIFMNPDDELELYPADFIIDLPRPPAYFGAERLFGDPNPSDADLPEDGLDVIREVPEQEALDLTPARPISEWAPTEPLPDSLTDAIRWFVLATALRRSRGQNDHNSMLIHTTQYVQPHFAVQRQVEDCVAELDELVQSDDLGSFLTQYEHEKDRAAGVRTNPMPTFAQVARQLPEAVRDVKVIVDNGSSTERLDYNAFNPDGSKKIQTVIAIGGGTLSRGLTLEGLSVSYFIRSSNTYDTLLQMGRWFGYRPGYEDLQRIWATNQLRDEFEFLGMIEAELRGEIRTMEIQNKTPRELGVRIRSHPGRLEITAKAKMYYASEVDLDFSGDFRQTFILHETDASIIGKNNSAALRLISQANRKSATEIGLGQVRHLWRGLSTDAIMEFLQTYSTHPDQMSLQRELLVGWLSNLSADITWNVGLASNPTKYRGTLGEWDAGLGEPVVTINRAPLAKSAKGTANIKTLRSSIDRVADLPREKATSVKAEGIPAFRAETVPKQGLLVLYPISHNSKPATSSRRAMQAPSPLIGYSISFPTVHTDGETGGKSYWAVKPTWEIDHPEVEDEQLPQDLEDDMPVSPKPRTGDGR